MVVTSSQINKPPPLDPEVEGVFFGEEEVVEEEVHFAKTMTNKGKGYTDPKKVEYIKLIQTLFDEITKNMNQKLMKGFEFLVSQFGIKLEEIGDSSSSQSKEKKTMGEHIFSRTRPHNRPHEFQITPMPNTPKFIIPK